MSFWYTRNSFAAWADSRFGSLQRIRKQSVAPVSIDIPKTYDPAQVESKWYTYWLDEGAFEAAPDSSAPAFSVVMPPPNITGSLHMGHALNITLQDILTRWKRMKGFNALWVPGTDHAGIATQNVVERQLAERGLHRNDLGRKKFEEEVWAWKATAEKNILTQVRRLGCCCDWSRTRFTMDEGLSRAVREVFVRLYQDGLIYRGEYLVNWCFRCSTAISDLEVEYSAVEGHLWYLKYPISGSADFVVVATSRPETMLGDTAVAIHPDDHRCSTLQGRTVRLPLIGREIPIVADSFVEREFGTGMVKVTPGHDPNDFEIGRRHDLKAVKVIGEDGKMTAEAGTYAGLDHLAARRRVVADLQARGLIQRIDKYLHNVGHCQRCQTVVEPLVSTQWFVRVQSLAQPAIEAVEQGRTVFVPANYAGIYFQWMRNIHDWCISRQLWWGHQIPAWHCRLCGEITVSRETPQRCSHCKSDEITQETDVLDTWFSSGLWPFSTLGWPEKTPELERYYPTSTLVTGFDIIFFWVARMMMLGLRFMKDVPFRQVHINGLVRDEQGQKMSKSRGNVIDPLKLIDQYGADPIRFTLSVMAVPGTDIPFSVSRMAGYRAFCTKIWNAGRFLLLNLDGEEVVDAEQIDLMRRSGTLKLEDRWILSCLQELIRDTNENLDKFRFHEASNELYHFFWSKFCSWYIELVKARITGPDGPERDEARRVALYLLETSLRLLHPFVPFVTEELWQRLPHQGDYLLQASFPEPRLDWLDAAGVEAMTHLQELISAIRSARTGNQVQPRQQLPCQLVAAPECRQLLQEQQGQLKALGHLEPVQFVERLPESGLQVRGASHLAEFSLLLEGFLDKDAERIRLAKKIDSCQRDVYGLQSRLDNKSFVERAPAAVVEKTRLRWQDSAALLEKLKKQLAGLG